MGSARPSRLEGDFALRPQKILREKDGGLFRGFRGEQIGCLLLVGRLHGCIEGCKTGWKAAGDIQEALANGLAERMQNIGQDL
jgi:hypothetical protein